MEVFFGESLANCNFGYTSMNWSTRFSSKEESSNFTTAVKPFYDDISVTKLESFHPKFGVRYVTLPL